MNSFNVISHKILIGITISLILIFVLGEYTRLGDFHIYLDASSDFIKGKYIYSNLYGQPAVFPYMGSPTLAFILSPLSFLPIPIPALIWKTISILLFLRIWYLIQLYLPLEQYKKTSISKFTLLCFMSTSFLLYFNLHSVQFTIFLLFSILESIYRVRDTKQTILGAFVLSLGIIVKVLPIVIIPYFIYRGYFKASIVTIILIIALLLVPSLFVGWEYNSSQFTAWVNAINPSKASNVFDVSTRSIHGIASLISILTIEGIGNPNSLDVKRNILNIEPENVIQLIYIAKLFLIGFSLFFLKLNSIFRDQQDKTKRLWEISYILGVTPLIFPQQRSYAFLFLFPAVVYLVYRVFLYSTKTFQTTTLVLILVLILLNLELLIGHFREYYWHFKTLTYASLFLLLTLSLNKPSKLESLNI